MDKHYTSGGTLHVCPYTASPVIVTFSQENGTKVFDRSECPHASECTDASCPLCHHLDS